MKQNKTNTALTPEELNELFGKPISSNTALDDFEREALEGYSEIDSLSKVKKLQEEVNLSISKRVNEDNEHIIITRKQKIIRLSIAASLFLLVSLSIIMYKSSFFEKESMVAVKETTSKTHEETEAKPTISSNELESSKDIPDQNTKTILPSDQNVASTKKTAQLDEDKSKEQEVQPNNSVGAASGAVSQDVLVPKEPEQIDDLSKREEVAEKSVAKDKKETLSKRKAKLDDEANSNSQGAELAEAKAAAPQSVSESDRSSYMNDENADMKQRILNYYKINKLESSELKGLYKIKVAIKSNGKLKVLSVINNSNDSKTKQHIEDAINDIKNWTSNKGKQKNIVSETDFEIQF